MMWPDRHVVRITYTGSADREPVLSHEHTEYRWSTLEEILQLTEGEFDRFLKALISENADLLR
jgi:hypothetical protein